MTLCIAALRVDVDVESCIIVFLGRYFLFTSSDTFSRTYRLITEHSERLKADSYNKQHSHSYNYGMAHPVTHRKYVFNFTSAKGKLSRDVFEDNMVEAKAKAKATKFCP